MNVQQASESSSIVAGTITPFTPPAARLTPTQLKVMDGVRSGLLNKQIAYELKVSEATIKAHVSAILQKLGVESRTQAVIAAAKISGSH